MKKTGSIFLAFLILAHWMNVAGQDKSVAPPNWAGKWRGSLTNFPLRAGAAAIEVTMEIGAFPVADNACTQFRSTFAEDGRVRQVKDYRLCRGKGAGDLFIDEGSNGIKLTARLIGDTLVSPFKYDNLLLISSMRLHGDVLEEDILTVDDQPAVKGVQTLRPRGIQRITLKRVAAGS